MQTLPLEISNRWTAWALWSVACAVAVVSSGVMNAAFYTLLTELPSPLPYAGWAFLAAIVIPRVMEWATLRWAGFRPSLWAWFGVASLSLLIWLTVASLARMSAGSSIGNPAFALELPRSTARNWSQWIALPWGSFIAACIGNTLINWTAPMLLLSCGNLRHLVILLAAGVSGTLAASIMVAVDGSVRDYVFILAHHQTDWNRLWQSQVAGRAANGAIWGAVSGLVYIGLSASPWGSSCPRASRDVPSKSSVSHEQGL